MKEIISLNIFIQNFSNMQYILYTIHSKWYWNESKMLIEFLSLEGNYYLVVVYFLAYIMNKIMAVFSIKCVLSAQTTKMCRLFLS